MKKSYLIICMLLLAISFASASNARLRTLGTEPAMLVDDDVSINLFPQRINDFNIARVEGLGQNQPGYLVVIGEKGDKWGAWGSSNTSEDLLNMYRSLSTSSALELSFRLYREKIVDESSAENDERTLGGFNTGVKYGWDNIDSEKALGFNITYGPSGVYQNQAFSSFDYKTYGYADTTSISGSSHIFDMGAFYSNRTDCKLAIFNKRYDHIGVVFGTGAEEITNENVKTTEEGINKLQFSARTFLFNMQNINEAAKLYYGVGAGTGYFRWKTKDEITDIENTDYSFYFGSLELATGLEVSLDKLDLRIGLNRTNTLYNREGNKTENGSTTEHSESYISSSMTDYGIRTGLGYNYKGVQINVELSNQLWRSGPQMLFDSGAGNIFTTFDIVYNF